MKKKKKMEIGVIKLVLLFVHLINLYKIHLVRSASSFVLF